MKRIGITGQKGFVGSHLYNTLGLTPDEYERIDFHKEFFEDAEKLDAFVSKCDVIVHLAAMNRHPDPEVIYRNNIALVQSLVESLERTGSSAHVLFSSSSQEERDNLYGKSKRTAKEQQIRRLKSFLILHTQKIQPYECQYNSKPDIYPTFLM